MDQSSSKKNVEFREQPPIDQRFRKPKMFLYPEVKQRAEEAQVVYADTRPITGRSSLDSDHFNGF